MAGLFWRRRRRLGLWAWSLVFAAAISLAPARADTIKVSVDQAKVLKLPEKVATIVIGNPLIADASLQSGGILVVTGKGYGETNLLALDRGGDVVMTKDVRVVGPASRDLVVVYRGIAANRIAARPNASGELRSATPRPILPPRSARAARAPARPAPPKPRAKPDLTEP